MLDFLSSLMYYIQALNTHCDSLAQLAEHLTFNQGVRGSNPRWLTKRKPFEIKRFQRVFCFLRARYSVATL